MFPTRIKGGSLWRIQHTSMTLVYNHKHLGYEVFKPLAAGDVVFLEVRLFPQRVHSVCVPPRDYLQAMDLLIQRKPRRNIKRRS